MSVSATHRCGPFQAARRGRKGDPTGAEGGRWRARFPEAGYTEAARRHRDGRGAGMAGSARSSMSAAMAVMSPSSLRITGGLPGRVRRHHRHDDGRTSASEAGEPALRREKARRPNARTPRAKDRQNAAEP